MPSRPNAPTDGTPDFLVGGGEMGALLRSHDWSGSSLGPPASWPQPLRTVVRLMLNSGHPMYIFWGADHACLYNDAYCESIGPERHPGSMGRPGLEVWNEIWDLIGPQIAQVMSGGGATWHVDHLVPITRHGAREEVYWTYSYSPVDDEAAPGGIGGVLVVCTETTQHVLAARHLAADRDQLARTHAALRETEASFRSALRAGRLGSWETDRTTMTRSWSQEGMDLFGLNLPAGRGQVGGELDEYLSAMHPDDRHLAQHFHELADRQDSFAAEYRIVRPDGKTLWLSGRGLVVARSADGRAQRLVSIMADATERNRAQEALRVERERLTLALSAGQMGAYDLDIEHDVLWWSPQTYALFGLDSASFTPTPQRVAALLLPGDRDTFQRLRAEAIERRLPFGHEFRIVRPDGTQVWLAQRGQADYDTQGRPVRSFGIVMDITERRQVEQMLRDADQKKDDFIATLAHELRNPLAPIRNAVNVLRRVAPADAQVAWCHDVIGRQVGQMAHLLDDLLDVSRLTRGELRLRLQPLLLATAIEQAIEIAQPLIDDGGHTLSVTLPAQPLSLQGDLTRLAQVFSNILINAAKYTPRGGRITLSVEQQGQQAVVKVMDTGIGIAAEHLSQIFRMFGQVETVMSRSHGGQGIGLSLGKGLVELHGGSIRARSAGPGKGSEFEVRLPLAWPAICSDVPDAADEAAAKVAGSATAKLRILVADDVPDIADSLAILLQAMGHDVSVAYDGEQALHLANSLRPEVVVLDIGMPKMNGYDVCRHIRAAAWGSEPLVIAQTGWGQQADRMRTSQAGFDHHVTKPIDPGALLALFERPRPPQG